MDENERGNDTASEWSGIGSVIAEWCGEEAMRAEE
jgi:hypothetical protein